MARWKKRRSLYRWARKVCNKGKMGSDATALKAQNEALWEADPIGRQNIACPSQGKINVLPCWHSRAGVAELVDALDLGSSG